MWTILFVLSSYTEVRDVCHCLSCRPAVSPVSESVQRNYTEVFSVGHSHDTETSLQMLSNQFYTAHSNS